MFPGGSLFLLFLQFPVFIFAAIVWCYPIISAKFCVNPLAKWAPTPLLIRLKIVTIIIAYC
jgi:hypothetical protein